MRDSVAAEERDEIVAEAILVGLENAVRAAVIFDQLGARDLLWRRPGRWRRSAPSCRRCRGCTSVGTPSKLLRSGRKSVVANALAAASVGRRPGHHRLAPGVHQHLVADRRGTKPTPKKSLKKPLHELPRGRSSSARSSARRLSSARRRVVVASAACTARPSSPAPPCLTRFLPCLVRKRATSPPPIEKPTSDNFLLDSGILEHRRDIIGIGVVIVSVPWLVRAAEAAAVGKDAAVAGLDQLDRRRVPGVGGQRPAVQQDDRDRRVPQSL